MCTHHGLADEALRSGTERQRLAHRLQPPEPPSYEMPMRRSGAADGYTLITFAFISFALISFALISVALISFALISFALISFALMMTASHCACGVKSPYK